MNVTTIEGDEILVDIGAERPLRFDLHIWNKRKMARHEWRAHINGRHAYTQLGAPILAHRYVMNARPGQVVDHKDGDPLNCRLDNLRFCTQSQNLANTRVAKSKGGYKGVSWQNGKWSALIRFKGRRYYMGRFTDPKRAAAAYDRAALALSGEFAALNFEDRRASYRPKMPKECGASV